MLGKRKKELSNIHKSIMKAIKRYQAQKGYPPSIREIQAIAGISSTSLVDYHLDRLEEIGFIERDRGVSRGVRLTDQPAQAVSENIQIPILAMIAAGDWLPIPTSDFAYYDAESTIEVPQSQLPTRAREKELYAIEVLGDSMIDAMINDGDIVILKPAHEVRNGEMVAIWRTDENATTLNTSTGKTGMFAFNPRIRGWRRLSLMTPAPWRFMVRW